MSMITVTMEYAKWQQILNIVGNTRDFPWTITNPLLLELGKQIEPQQAGRGNSKEMPINIEEVGGVKQ